MELIVKSGERVERVEISRDGARYRLRLGEREVEVDVRALGPFVRSLLVDGEHHEAAVLRARDGRYRIGWAGRTTEVEVVDPLTHLAEQAHGGALRHGRQSVAAYMPGRVVSIAVEVGQAVEPGQALVVLEAMKMQNEIQADRAGRISAVHVVAGQAVEGGDPLLEIE